MFFFLLSTKVQSSSMIFFFFFKLVTYYCSLSKQQNMGRENSIPVVYACIEKDNFVFEVFWDFLNFWDTWVTLTQLKQCASVNMLLCQG